MIYVAVYHSLYDKKIEVHLHITNGSMEDVVNESQMFPEFQRCQIETLSREESKFVAHKTFAMKISKSSSENDKQIKSISRKMKSLGLGINWPVPSWLVHKIDQLIAEQQRYEMHGRGEDGST